MNTKNLIIHTIAPNNDENDTTKITNNNNTSNISMSSRTTQSISKSNLLVTTAGIAPNNLNPKPNGATSLLEKYATLNNAISSTRSQITQIQKELSSITNKINALHTDNKSITDEFQTQIESTIPSIKDELKCTMQEYYDLVQKYKQSNQELDIVKQSLETLNRKKEEDRKEFLRSCHDFKVLVRRNRVCLDGLLLGAASSSGTSGGGDHINQTSTFENNNNNNDDGEDDDEYDNHEEQEDNDADSMTISTNASTLSNSLTTAPPLHHRTATSNSTSTNLLGYGNDEENDYHGVEVNNRRRNRMRKRCTVSPVPNTLSSTEKNKRRRTMYQESDDDHDNNNNHKQRHHHHYHDLLTSNQYANDVEINQAKQIMDNTSNISKQTTQSLAQIKYERKVLEDRATSRARQLQLQRNQLDKARMDVQDMERRIASLEENTVECRQISDGYAKDAERRRKKLRTTAYMTPIGQTNNTSRATTITPSSNSYTSNYAYQSSSLSSNTNQNPYTRRGTTLNNNGNGGISTTLRSTIQNPYKTKPTKPTSRATRTASQDSYRTALAKQHPHRAGRIRVDKRFSTALSITSNLEDYDDDATDEDEEENDNDETRNSSDEKRKRDGNSFSSSSSSQQKQDGMNKEQNLDGCCNVSVDGSLASKKSTLLGLSDDDDEDEDDLLLYIPFD